MTFQDIILSIGIPTIVVALVYIGRKLQVLDNVERTVESMRDRFTVVEERVKMLWKDEVAPAGSPRQLNERGNAILSGSGIKALIDAKRDDLFVAMQAKNLKNPYDAEQCVLQAVADFKKDSAIVDTLKTGAYSVGADIDTVLLVGGIYLRDKIFTDLGFAVTDLDAPRS